MLHEWLKLGKKNENKMVIGEEVAYHQNGHKHNIRVSGVSTRFCQAPVKLTHAGGLGCDSQNVILNTMRVLAKW